MSIRSNPLSAIGRMSYLGNLILYPLIGGASYFLYHTYSTRAAVKQAAVDLAAMPKAKAVDPDDF